MYRSIIAALLMAAATAYGQSTSTWQTVTMQDGTSALSTNGTPIGDVRGTFRPAYGSFQAGSTPLATALSVVDIIAVCLLSRLCSQTFLPFRACSTASTIFLVFDRGYRVRSSKFNLRARAAVTA